MNWTRTPKNLFATLGLALLALPAFADGGDEKKPTPEQVQQWLWHHPIRLHENKGQMLNVGGEPVPFVLFQAEALGMSAFVTETGLTYVLKKLEREEERGGEEKDEERKREGDGGKPRHREEHEEEVQYWEHNWVHVRLEGATIRRENIVREGESKEHYNYFSKHVKGGLYDVHAYDKVTIREVYHGIDWVIYSSLEKGFKYDFVVHPGADASRIALVYHSEEPITVDDAGNLTMHMEIGTLTEAAPVCYVAETQAPVQSRFARKQLDQHRVRITYAVGDAYAWRNSTLVIDPQLVWATWTNIPETVDGALTIAVGPNGNVVTSGYGNTQEGATGFPSVYDTLSFDGAYLLDPLSQMEGWVHTFSGTGELLWSTTGLGGEWHGLTIDSLNRIIFRMVGFNGYQPGIGSFTGAFYDDTLQGGALVCFSPNGVLEWATTIPGGYTASTCVAADATGRIVTQGGPLDDPYPGVPGTGSFAGAYYTPPVVGQPTLMGFSPDGQLEWLTGIPYQFGNTAALAFAPNGGLFVAVNSNGDPSFATLATGPFAGATMNALSGQWDGYITAFSPNGVQQWGTYFQPGDGYLEVNTVMVDVLGRPVVVGNVAEVTTFTSMASGSFGSGYQDAVPNGVAGSTDPFLVGFSGAGVQEWSTLLGGSVGGYMGYSYQQLGVDADGNIYVSYDAAVGGIPVLDNGCGSPLNGLSGVGLACLLRFAPSGALNWCNYIGPVWRTPIAVSHAGDLYTTGEFGAGAPLLDPGAGAYMQPELPGTGADDSYVAHFAPSPCDTASSPLFVVLDCTSVPCWGECSATCTAQGIQGVGPYTYQWGDGQTGATASGLCGGAAVVIVTDASGQSTTINYAIPQPFPVSISTTGGTSLCTSNTGSASVTVSGIAIGQYTVLWETGGTSEVITGLGPGTYTVAVSDTSGCTYLDSAVVLGVSQPNATATAVPNAIEEGGSAQLVGTGSGNYLWTPATGLSCTTCASPIATPTDTSTYCLVVVDANQCSDTACVTINVVVPPPPCNVFVPSAFSPNASGKNDTQCVYGACITTMVFSIYDRWGNKVFESADPKQCWDGTFKGQALDPAVFVYKLTATMTTGETVEKQGNITLVR